MKHILTIVATLFMVITASHAQQQLKPSQTVQVEKSFGATFQKVTLFQSIDHQKANIQIPDELKEFTVFSLNQQKMASFKSGAPETMSLQIPGQRSAMSLELVKVQITTDDYQIIEMPSGKAITPQRNISHYRGIIKGNPNSIAAVSILDGEVTGVISSEDMNTNLVIGQIKNSRNHIIYEDRDINHLNDFVCQSTNPDFEGYTEDQLEDSEINKEATSCPKIFFDIARDIVQDKGGAQGASDYIEAVFNQVTTLYANDNISIKLSGINAWTGSQPFANDLGSYRNYRNQNSFNGDLGHLVTYDFSGGVAYLSAACTSYKYGVSGINRNFSNVPTYSWTVMVVSHELGHNLGSNHTQACVWNGNNTAIDGCYQTEGGCARPGIPSGGGTIMSYCHLTSAGINLSKGFGPQPGNVIRNTINNTSCHQSCDGGGGGGDGDICDGVSPWSSNTSYSAGDQVTYQGYLFEWTGSSWNQLGQCGDTNSNDPCDGISEWSSNQSYSVGDKVTYRGNLYERTNTGWKNLGACGAQAAALPGTSLKEASEFTVYPNPAVDILNIEINNLEIKSSQLYIRDVNGRTMQTINLDKGPDGNINQALDISSLASGVYFIQITSTEKSFTQKIFVE